MFDNSGRKLDGYSDFELLEFCIEHYHDGVIKTTTDFGKIINFVEALNAWFNFFIEIIYSEWT